MVVIYFVLDDGAPVIRCWSYVPRIGDTVALPEHGGIAEPLRVYRILWEGGEEATVTVFLHRTRGERETNLWQLPKEFESEVGAEAGE